MSKLVSLEQAIADNVGDGDVVAIEGFGHLVPFAAGQEVIRQGRKNLTLARMSCDSIVDQLIAAGCVDTLIASFIGNGAAGSLHEVRRRAEGKVAEKLEIEEYSHGSMVARYTAGAANLPFYPTRSFRGSDTAVKNPKIKTVPDPYSGETIYVVPPLNPDVTLIHAQRADREGNIQAWGITGLQTEAALAAKRLVVTVEEVVGSEVVRSDPNRTIVPSFAVDAIVHVPYGGYPHAVQGYYDRDDEFLRFWSDMARDAGQLRAWIETNVQQKRSHQEFLDSLAAGVLENLGVGVTMSSQINYGGSQ